MGKQAKRARKKAVRDERLAIAAAQRRRRAAMLVGAVVLIAAVVTLALFTGGDGSSTAACGAEAPDEADPATYDSPPEMALGDGVDYAAVIHTSCGDITMDLLEDDTPKTVNNFVFLAREEFYDGLKWHRVEKDLVIQGGDPEGTGEGGPGYSIPDELPDSPKGYTFGAVGMANSGPDSGGSQFFIVVRDPNPDGGFKPAPFPPSYSLFGRVDPEDEESADTLTAIADVPVRTAGPDPAAPPTRPRTPVYIESIDIEES